MDGEPVLRVVEVKGRYRHPLTAWLTDNGYIKHQLQSRFVRAPDSRALQRFRSYCSADTESYAESYHIEGSSTVKHRFVGSSGRFKDGVRCVVEGDKRFFYKSLGDYREKILCDESEVLNR